jgi:hypothetical protein
MTSPGSDGGGASSCVEPGMSHGDGWYVKATADSLSVSSGDSTDDCPTSPTAMADSASPDMIESVVQERGPIRNEVCRAAAVASTSTFP